MPRLVMIIDDSEACAETLQIALETLPDVELCMFRSLSSALEALACSEVAAIITDLHVRREDGLELIREIRREARFARTPVILISGDSDPAIARTALAGGADAFFAKPYSPAAVRRKLEELICSPT